MKTVLIFGGNGFIGSETVLQLMDLEDLKIYLINRDRSWNRETRAKLMTKIEQLFKWNRNKPLEKCAELMLWLDEVNEIDYVFDFSGYTPDYVENALHVLGSKVKLYTYVSTDSVYEICSKAHTDSTYESDDQRPPDKKERKRLAKSDRYGYEKWQCEDVLKTSGVKYVILRLADVIGPNDSTERWVQLQLWIKAAVKSQLPIRLPDDVRDKHISLVYVKDVAQLLVSLVREHSSLKDVENNAFNVAFKKTTTVGELVNTIAANIGCESCRVEYVDPASTVQFYPSVEKGPIDISKAEDLLQWRPTPMDEAISRTVDSYEEMLKGGMSPNTRSDLYHSILEDLSNCYTDEDMKRFRKELEKMLMPE